jgi:hypothetical protein
MSSRRTFTALLCLFILVGGGPPADSQVVRAISGKRSEALRLLSSELGLGGTEGPIKCGLPIIFSARQRLAALSPAARSALSLLGTRPTTDTSILRNGFRIHFDTLGLNTPALLDGQGNRLPGTARAFAESVGTTLGFVQAVELGQLGYPSPLADGGLGGGPEPDVYILDLGNSYGETWPDIDPPEGGTTSTYMTIHNDFSFVTPGTNRGLRGMKVTVAHEFHHAVQLGNYGYWFNDVYFYEITSTWMEDVVYHGINDYLNYLVAGFSHFRNPATPFTSNDLIEYSRGIWGKFVERTYGRDAMKRSWEYVRQYRPLQAIDAALHERGSSFSLAYSEWTRWNYFTGTRADTAKSYREGSLFPEVAQLPADFTPPSTTLTGSLEPYGARYHQVFIPGAGGSGDTLTVAVSNLNFATALAGTGSLEAYSCMLAASRLDASYVETGAGVFARFSVANPATWSVWFLVGANAYQPFGVNALAEGTAFPNPFYADGRSRVSIPVDAGAVLTGSLQIYSTGMDLVYSSEGDPSSVGTRKVFTWDGTVQGGSLAKSGIYIFVLSLANDRTVTGKIALLRK